MAREAELRRAATALREGRGVFVYGARGSGRSRFVREVLATLDVEVRARIWVGEDIQTLQGARAAQFAEAVRSGSMVPLTTVRTPARLHAELDELWREDEVLHVELPGYSANQLLQIAEGFLGGALHHDAVPAVIPRRGGTDLVALRETLAEAQRSGAIELVNGFHSLTGVPLVSTAVRRSLHAAVRGPDAMSPEVGELLDLLALVPGVGLESLERMMIEIGATGPLDAELERLEEDGIIAVEETPTGALLRLADGIAELHLPQSIGVMRRRRLATGAVATLGTVPTALLASGEIVALARHGLWLGRDVDAAALVRALRISLRELDPDTTAQLARAATAAGEVFDGEMALAAVEAHAGRPAAALTRLQNLSATAQDERQLSEVVSAWLRHATERRGVDLEAHVVPVEMIDVESPLRIEALNGFILHALEDSTGAVPLVEPALDVLSGEDLAHAHYIIANGALLDGRLARAHAALDSAEQILLRIGGDTSHVHVTGAYVRSFEGRIPEALAVIENFRDAATAFGHWPAQAFCAWSIGTLMLTMGRATDAVIELRAALAAMERLGMSRTVLLVRTDLATALAWLGEPVEAQRILEPARQPLGPVDIEPKVLQAQGWIHAAAGHPALAAECFLGAADAYEAPGHVLPSLIALCEAARCGAARRVLNRVEALSAEVEGAYAGVLVRMTRVLAADGSGDESDADEFEAIGSAAAELELHMVAAEAHSHASVLHRRAGAPRQATAAERRRDEQMAICGVDRLLLVDDRFGTGEAIAPATLSVREEGIARRAADGASNREIAAELVLSVRTVETHLLRIYRKLGVRTRAELGDALGSSGAALS